MRIRRANLEDAEPISILIAQLAARHILPEFVPPARRIFQESNNEEAIGKNLASNFVYFVAEIDSRIVGVVGVKENTHLYHLFVDEPYQGLGLGRKLWETVMNHCLEQGNPGSFTVNSSNHAVGLYEKIGFVRTGPMESKQGVLFNPMELNLN